MSVLPILAVLAVVGLGLYLYFAKPKVQDGQTILSGTQSGTVETTNRLALPLSMNEPEGIAYTYSMWVLIKDFTTGYGTRRTILNKGDCPGVYLDSTSNSILVAIKTYGAKETILISNIPALKWIHLAIVVNQQSVDIYVNGTLRQHHTLGQLPDQNEDPVVIGGGWNGVVGNVTYNPRTLSYNEIHALASTEPPPFQDQVIGKKDYFDITWYIGRLNSA